MTHEQIEAIIERLRAIQLPCDIHEIFGAFNVGAGKCFRDVLVELLEQADPDSHIELPKDADGVPIHVGDELVSNHSKKRFVAMRLQYSRRQVWLVDGADRDNLSMYGFYEPRGTRHYHKPTIEDVLYACCSEYHDAMLMGTCDIPCDVPSLSEVISKYAEKLRESMKDDQ